MNKKFQARREIYILSNLKTL